MPEKQELELMATDKARVSTYIDQDLYDKVKKLADAEDRSVSNFMERLLKEVVAKAEQDGRVKEIDNARE